MKKVVAVFGAGTGLGAGVARRFGREGYAVALVARRQEALSALANSLADEGIETKTFAGDLIESEKIPDLVRSIEAALGSIDVVEYAPITTAAFIPAKNLSPTVLDGYLRLYVTSLVTLVNAVLPGMRSRRSGAILVGHGVSAVHGSPFMSGVGPAMAAARNYLFSLHGEVKDEGIYVGTIAVAAMIEGSAGQMALLSGDLGVTMPAGTHIPTVSPDDLAALYWTMMTAGTEVERIFPSQAE